MTTVPDTYTTVPTSLSVAYVVKRYPVYSQTFIVNEILAHEAAGFRTRIFALHPPNDAHFQDSIARVRAPVTYLHTSSSSVKASELWARLRDLSAALPLAWERLGAFEAEDVGDVYRAVLLALAVRRDGIQHLHAHFATSATTVARMAAQFAGITYSFTAHARDIFSNEVQPRDLARKLADASAVVTVSDFNTHYLQETYPDHLISGTLHRIYNGLNLTCFAYQSPHSRPRKIVAVGRLEEKKGFADLLDACAHLQQHGTAFDCDIIGDGELAQVLQAHIVRHNLQDRVHLLGALPQQVVMQRVQGAAVFVAPCVIASDDDRDGLPTVLIEAMSLGTPCISTNVTGIPELIRHDDTGLQVPQRNPVELAEAIAKLLDDAMLRQRLATCARRLIEAEFDVDQNAAALRSIWQTTISTSKSAPSTPMPICPEVAR